ncbi:tetr family transcriptional regulator [Rhodococcus gordoniae]|uniref:Tetr family transcriptional regulator n=1 Tax=Rhodococcus gordoniae TaxID=223392 RepID=A0A379LVF7_9NOCA|nr:MULTISPECIES: TetR family transcriptional regulator [Rhodococcus]AYA27870.1 TetR/AcrR family transcriptional regulator [Rhodococcus rhodochrous]MXQ77553.1 TetR family transcriptional regulator [Rhodococcus rhodochrous]UTT50113.1 TetR family transcriptional regulator [Rhodococcus gordoniae]SUE13526.1 tetr family transcriptional regulator [Rhodococcus gordoniae]BDB60053.1 putative transcriptional regulator, TetR family protein [Rhodococcus sp. RDE2]
MPRLAEVRDAAEPNSAEQHARYGRIIDAAAQLGAEKELERVRMQEVAELAGVAIGTLYRYFPSKTHLFVAVMVDQIDRMGIHLSRRSRPSAAPADAVYDALLQATRALVRAPLLANAMIQSAASSNAATIPDVAKIDRHFDGRLLAAAGIDEPTVRDVTVVRLLVALWFGLVRSALNGRMSIPEVESDLRVACDLLLVDLSAGVR